MFHIEGSWSFVWGLSPQKPPRDDGTESNSNPVSAKFNLFIIILFCLWADTKFTVWTHTLCRTQVDKNRRNRT